MKRHHLSKKEIKNLINELSDTFNQDLLSKKDKVELVEDEFKFISINGEASFIYIDDKLIPTLKTLLKNNFLKQVVVDMGAVKFVTSGADVMRPGIVKIDESIMEGEIISIIDEKNKKPLAIGKSLFSGQDLKNKTSGKSIKSIHFVGDKIWNS